MSEHIEPLPIEAARLVGDPHPLAQQLSSPSTLARFTPATDTLPAAVCDLPSLRGFVTWYRTEILTPAELPAIRKAFDHASRYEVRELLALDATLAGEPRLQPFAQASQAVGRSQLWRLLPMRDQRLVRRYWNALEAGHAHGWHVLIYGVVLAVFSLPLRQGLLNYGRQTIAGFVDSAARTRDLAPAECAQLLEEESAAVRTATEFALGPGKPRLTICAPTNGCSHA